jgi:hypothetical protein
MCSTSISFAFFIVSLNENNIDIKRDEIKYTEKIGYYETFEVT